MYNQFRVVAALAVAALGIFGYSVAAAASHSAPHQAGAPARAHASRAASASSATCTSARLGAAFEGGSEPGTGNSALGFILLWDKSGAACTLTAPIKVAGLNRAGHRVTQVVRFTVGAKTMKLSAHGAGPNRRGQIRKGEVFAQMLLIAAGPHPHGGPGCSGHLVAPATWRIELRTGGSALIAANRSPRRGPALNAHGGLTTCRGHLGGQNPILIERS
jgi:hypothetical protein